MKTLKISDEAHAKLTSVVGRLMAETGKTKTGRMETLKEMIRAFGMNPEQILTKEAMSMPNRTVIVAGNEPSEGQMDTLLKALRQKLKEELLEKPIAASKTV